MLKWLSWSMLSLRKLQTQISSSSRFSGNIHTKLKSLDLLTKLFLWKEKCFSIDVKHSARASVVSTNGPLVFVLPNTFNMHGLKRLTAVQRSSIILAQLQEEEFYDMWYTVCFLRILYSLDSNSREGGLIVGRGWKISEKLSVGGS